MTTSNETIWDMPFTDAIEEAYDRAVGQDMGGPRSGYDMRGARRSINLLLSDWSNRGVNLWTISERTQALTFNVGSYDLTAVSGNDIVDVIEQVVQIPTAVSGPNVSRLNMSRVSISTQATRTNPNITGRPTEVWYDRRTDGVTAHIWPLPDATGSYTLVYTVLRRMDDAGAYTDTADMPYRFLPAFIAGLAFYIAQKKQPANTELLMRLESDYEKTWTRASEEDREKAPLYITPRGDAYRVW
jgi:hypothetical protein